MNDALVSGLVDHRQGMLDELYAIHARAKRLMADLPAVEAAIRVLEPAITLEAAREIDLAGIETKVASTARHIFAVLKGAGRPMPAREIAEEIMRERGLDLADHAMVRVMARRAKTALRPQKLRGTVRSVPGDGPELLWEMART